jgi:hypothetical protein
MDARIAPRHGLARRFLLGVALAGLALAATAQGASAMIVTASHSLDINPGGTRSPAAACQPGAVPLSSGFSVAGFTAAKGGIVPFSSQRTAGGASTDGRNVSPTVTGTLTTYAYCDTGPRSIVTKESHAGLPINKPRSLTATCPPGTAILSGGYKVANSRTSSGDVYRSRRVANGWQAAGYNGGSGQATLRVFAYCQRNAHPLATKSAFKLVPKQKLGAVQANCPAGTIPIAGGFDGHLVTTTTSSQPRGVVPIDSVRTATGWRVTGFTVSDGASARLTAYVYCQ